MTEDHLPDTKTDEGLLEDLYGRSRFQNFEDLMSSRVENIILVSSLYDKFILQEDGHLSEVILGVPRPPASPHHRVDPRLNWQGGSGNRKEGSPLQSGDNSHPRGRHECRRASADHEERGPGHPGNRSRI